MAFLDEIKQGALENWHNHKILPSITGAQASLESGWGKSKLALPPNNNLFGIKASSDWTGPTVSMSTQEYGSNGSYMTTASFRVYDSWNHSVSQHGAFFTNTPWRTENYKNVVGETDYKKAAKALQSAGYATDPGYANKLIKLIEEHKLYEWDKEALEGKPSTAKKVVGGSLTDSAKTATKKADVTLIGDSLGVGTKQYLESVFGSFNADVLGSRQITHATDSLNGTKILTNMKSAGTLKSTVVVILGTNRGVTDAEVDNFISIAGASRKVIFVDTNSAVNHKDSVATAYKKASDKHANAYYANWSTYSANLRSRYYGSDDIHMNSEGYRTHASFIQQAVYESTLKATQTNTSTKAELIDINDIVYDQDGYVSVAGESAIYNTGANQNWYFKFNGESIYPSTILEIDSDDPQEIFEAGLQHLKDNAEPLAQYTINLADIPFELSIGDTGLFIDHNFNPPLYLQGRVLSITTSSTDPSRNQVVIGNTLEVRPADKTDILKIQKDLQETRDNLVNTYRQGKPIVLRIDASNGNILKEGLQETTLVVTAFKDDEDITENITKFEWTRDTTGIELDAEDEAYNNMLKETNTTASLNIKELDVTQQATFTVRAYIDNNLMAQNSAVIKNILDPRYTHIVYADDEEGNGISTNPNGKDYVGISYNKRDSETSLNKDDYVFEPKINKVVEEVNQAIKEAEEAKADAVKAYEDAVAEAKRSADEADALIRTEIEQEIATIETEVSEAKQEAINASNKALEDAKAHAIAQDTALKTSIQSEIGEVEAELSTAKQEAINASNKALTDAKAHAIAQDTALKLAIQGEIDTVGAEVLEAKQEAQNAYTNAVAEAEAKVQAKDEEYKLIFGGYDSTIEAIEADSQTAKTKAEQALTEAGISTDLAQTAKDLADTAKANASTAISNASKAQADASTAVSDASQAKADAQTAITEAGEAVDSANTAKTNAQTALSNAQTALSTAKNADTKSGLAETVANTAKTNAQTALDNSNTAIANAEDAITKAGQAVTSANTAKTNAQTAIDDAKSALTTAGSAKSTADTLSIKVDDLEGEVELKASQTEVDGISGTVSTHTTTLNQQATAIASKADKTVVDTLSGTVSNQGTLITQNATAIKSKASSELVNTIKGTVDTHTTEIAQNATDIASKASSTSVNALTGRVSTAETSIAQNAEAIESKASQTEVDDISGTVSGHTTTLSQHANQIASKAESSLVNTIKNTVDTHTTEISQNATDIASKASTSSVNTLTGRVDTAESNIGQNATAISQRVTTTTYNAGIASKENTVLKQSTAPTHVNGRLWLDTSVTPNILKRSNGTTWIKATPTTPGEVGAYSQSDGAGLAGRLTTAETNITQTATAITSKADKSTVDTLAGTVSTQGTTISQQADLIESKANQSEVDTVKGTVSGHTTTLSQHATAIASKADSSFVNTIKGTVDTHTTEIAQNATDIASKASSSSVNTLTGRVDTAESNITQNATAISQRVTTTTYNTGIATKENSVLKQTTAPAHLNGRLWLDTSVTPNVLKRSTGTAWVKATPTTASEVGAYSSSQGSALAGRVTTAETNITQTSEAIASKADKSVVDTLSGTVSTHGTTLTQHATSIASKASQTEVDTVKGTVSGHTSTLSQHATAISARLTSTQVNSLVDDKGLAKVTYVDNQISATADAINAELSKTAKTTDLNGMVTETTLSSKNFITASSVNTLLASYAKTTALNGMVTETTLATKNFVTAGSMSTTLSNYAQVNGVPTNTQFNTLKNSYDSMVQTIGTNGSKIAQMVMTDSSFQTTVSDMDIKSRLGTGKVLTDDPTFEKGVNGVGVYNNSSNGTVVITRESVPSGTHPTDTPWRLKITHTGTATPGYGGFVRMTNARANAEFVIRFTALIPAGRRLFHANNAIGTGGVIKWLTSREGTGNWEEYAYHVKSGQTGTFSNFGHTYLEAIGAQPTASAPLTWYIAKLEVIDISSSQQSQITQLADSWALTLKSGNDIKTQINASTDAIRLSSKFIHLNGSSLIDNATIKSAHIDTLNASKVTGTTAEFNTIRTGVLTTNAVSATHINGDTALFNKLFSTTSATTRLVAQGAWITDANIISLNASKITAGTIDTARLNASAIVTAGLTANVVKSTHIQADTALIDSIFATQALVDRLWAKTIWTSKITAMSLNASQITAGTISSARLDVTDLRTKILTANVIDATQINGSTALFDKLFSTTSATTRLVAQGAWITDANIVSLNASKITAGTIATARLNASDIVTKGLTTDVVTSTHIKASEALIDTIFGTTAYINKLTSKTAFINNIKAISIDVDKITGNTASFFQTAWQGLNSSVIVDSSKIRLTNSAKDFIEMNGIPELRSQDSAGTSAIMGKGRSHYYSGSQARFYIGSNLEGLAQYGIHIAKGQTFGIYRNTDSYGGTPAQYHVVVSGESWRSITTKYWSSSTSVNVLMQLNGYNVNNYPVLQPGDTVLIKAAVAGNSSGVETLWSMGTSSSGATRLYSYPEHVFGYRIEVADRARFIKQALFEASFVNNSDRRIKHDIKDTEVRALDHLDALTFKEYKLNSNGQTVPLGLIAQDSGILRVKGEDEGDYEGVDGLLMPMLAMKGVQELHAIVKEQAEEIRQLKEIINNGK